MVANKKQIAIIGANSILAQSLYKRMYKEYDVAQVYHIRKDKIADKENLIYIGDFLQSGNPADVIFFLSAIISFEESKQNVQKLFDTNIKLLLDISERFPSAKIIHASSVSVYKYTGEEMTENSPVDPVSSYSLSKLWAENIVKNHKGGGVNIRLSSLYGVQMNQDSFLPKIIHNAVENKEIILFGDGSRKQNYISADEASEYFYKAMNHAGKITLLAVAERSFSNIEVAQIIQEKVDGVVIKFSGEDEPKSFIYNNAFTKEKLAITTKYSFSDSLNDLIR